jgi:cell division septum initiation protein DivIVA
MEPGPKEETMTMHDHVGGMREDELSGASDGRQRSGTATAAKEAASEVAQDVKTTAREDAASVAEQARTEARRLAEQAKQEVRRTAEERGQQAATRLRTFSDQLTALADGRTEEAGPLVGYAQRARDELRAWADKAEQRGPQGVVSDVSNFARRRPGMFLLAAAGAGFAIGRLVRAERAVQQEQR